MKGCENVPRFLIVIEGAWKSNYPRHIHHGHCQVCRGNWGNPISRQKAWMHKAITLHIEGLIEDGLPVPESHCQRHLSQCKGIYYVLYENRAPPSLLCPFVENSEAPLNGIPDILESLFDGFTFRVATRKSRTTDNKTAIFRVFSDDDFQIHLIDIRWVRYNTIPDMKRDHETRFRSPRGSPHHLMPSLKAFLGMRPVEFIDTGTAMIRRRGALRGRRHLSCRGVGASAPAKRERMKNFIERSDLPWLVFNYFLFKRFLEIGASPLQIMQLVAAFNDQDLQGNGQKPDTRFVMEVPMKPIDRIRPKRCTRCGKIFLAKGRKVAAGDLAAPGLEYLYYCKGC